MVPEDGELLDVPLNLLVRLPLLPLDQLPLEDLLLSCSLVRWSSWVRAADELLQPGPVAFQLVLGLLPVGDVPRDGEDLVLPAHHEAHLVVPHPALPAHGVLEDEDGRYLTVPRSCLLSVRAVRPLGDNLEGLLYLPEVLPEELVEGHGPQVSRPSRG